MKKNKSINLKDMKNINKVNVLKTIWKNKDISRSELAEETGLSPATITAIIEELLNENRIIETSAGESSGGRKPILLQINPMGGYICAVNILASSITYTLINLELQKVAEFKETISEEIIIKRLYQSLIVNIDLLLEENNIDKKKLIGIGMSMPANLYDDVDKKVVLDTGISADRMEINEALKFYYRTPVYIQNEIDAKAIAEYHIGSVKQKNGYIYMDISEHIQVRIVYEGELVSNPVIKNEDLKHMIIDRNGPKCECGKRGCLDTLASLSALVRKIAHGTNNTKSLETSKIQHGDANRVDLEFINKHANEGDHFFIGAINEIADALYIGMLNFSSVFNVKNFVIGGKVRKIDYFDEALRIAPDKLTLSDNDEITIMVSTVTDETINIGNGAIVLSNFFI